LKNDLEIKQSRFGVRTRFDFGSERLTYTLRDTSGERRFSVPYEFVAPRNESTLVFNNKNFSWRLRFIPVVTFLASLAAINIGYDFAEIIEVASVAVFIALLVANFFNIFAVRFTIVPLVPSPPEAQGQPLRIIDDKRRASIFHELDRNWKLRMKLLHGTVNIAGDPAIELARLTWLRDNDVLSVAEFEVEAAKLRHEITGEPTAGRSLLN